MESRGCSEVWERPVDRPELADRRLTTGLAAGASPGGAQGRPTDATPTGRSGPLISAVLASISSNCQVGELISLN